MRGVADQVVLVLEQKRDELKKALLALLVEYQRRVSELVAYKCRSAKELLLVREMRVALWEHKNECLLPFQKVLPPAFRSMSGFFVSCVSCVSCVVWVVR